ncbi:hypothetical protein ACFRLW_44465, partial [Streptomyces sp. NPDC056728]
MTQTADTPPGPPRGSFLDEVKSAVTPRAALLVIGPIALQLLFIASYAGALHNPKPKDVAFGAAAPVPAVAGRGRALRHRGHRGHRGHRPGDPARGGRGQPERGRRLPAAGA